MNEPNIYIPQSWRRIELSKLSGVLIVIGAPDTGKSTFARYLFQRLSAEGKQAAYLDGDPGQSVLGPPTTMTMSLVSRGGSEWPPKGRTWRKFIGSTSPVGHMLAVIVGTGRLVQAARTANADVIVHDTSGLVDPSQGGSALKFAKIDLLQPAVIFAIQKKQELEPILQPIRRNRRSQLVLMGPAAAVNSRNVSARQVHRSAQFARHFQDAQPMILDWTRLAVYPSPRFLPNRLIALEDADGFTLGLGIVQEIDPQNRRVEVMTPVTRMDQVVSLNLGDVLIEPHTFRDHRIQY